MQIATVLIFLFQILTNPQDTSQIIEIEFLGTYQTGPAPCERLPDGSRRWARTTGFTVETLIKGSLQVGYIEIATDRHPNSRVQFLEGAAYQVSIALSEERFTTLELGDELTVMTYHEPLLEKEIKSIEKKTE